MANSAMIEKVSIYRYALLAACSSRCSAVVSGFYFFFFSPAPALLRYERPEAPKADGF